MKRWILFVTLFVLIGCSAPIATPTPMLEVAEPTTVAAIAPADEPTQEPTALPTPVIQSVEPTEAPVEETVEEPTEVPTSAPTEETVVVEVAEPEAELEEGLVFSAEYDYIANNRNPLTGELVENPEDLQRRPILCKISNSPPEWVRPQSGLNSADIIFEHYAEATITRFSALFYGQTPEAVGPVRSARLIDLELPLMYDASLCFSGGSSGEGQFRGVYNRVFETQFADRMLLPADTSYYRTGENKPYEHTFYTNPDVAWANLTNMGQNDAPQFVSQVTFSEQPPIEIAAPAETISISYGDGKGDLVEWTYDADMGKYRRAVNGEPIIDAIDDEQVMASNVIVLKATHVINYNICETQTETECIAFSTEIQIWGGGFVSVFRDGLQINGSWQRQDRNANGMMFTFFDDAGNPIPLQIGNTWIQVVPYEYINTPIEVR